jgi:hypothetical protein
MSSQIEGADAPNPHQEIPRFLMKNFVPENPSPKAFERAPQPPEATDDIVLDPPTAGVQEAMFAGDTGELRPETRRCLVALLSGPSVDGQRQPSLWSILVRDQKILQSRLHDIFLDLVVDPQQKVAFIRQVPSDDGESIPILLRRHQLTFIDSALVLFLRQRLTEADSANERAVVSLHEMTDHLSVFEKAQNNDGVRFDKQCLTAIEKVKALNLVRPIRASDGRFEISPTLKLLFGAEDIQMLASAYESLKAPSPIRAMSIDQAIAKGIAEGEEPEADLLDTED